MVLYLRPLRSCAGKRLCIISWRCFIKLIDSCFFLIFQNFANRYRPVYKAFRSDSSFNFMIFFMIFFFQFVIMIFQAVGVYGSGYCGFITAIDQFDGSVKGALCGVLALTVAASFAICAAASFILLTKVCSSCFIIIAIRVDCCCCCCHRHETWISCLSIKCLRFFFHLMSYV